MKELIKQYNELDGKIVSVKTLKSILIKLKIASGKNNYYSNFYNKLNTLLKSNASSKEFDITISEKMIVPKTIKNYKKPKKNNKKPKKTIEKKDNGLKLSIQPVKTNISLKNKPKEQFHYVEKGFSNDPAPEVRSNNQRIEKPKKVNPIKKSNQNHSTVLNSNDIMNMEFETMTFTGKWADFMQDPSKNIKINIWGKPKNGKTAGAMKFAEYLTNFGSVLYNFADQGFNKNTKDLWKLSGLANKPNAFAVATRDFKKLDELCASGDYDFIFIDMINTYINHTKIKPFEFEEKFIKKYPNISFILVFEVSKSGNFRGDQAWSHLPDALITVDSFVMHNQGRYGVGEYVIWKDGLKKTNSKKYKDFFQDEEKEDVKTNTNTGKLVISSF